MTLNDPFATMRAVPALTITSTTVHDGQEFAPAQMSGLMGVTGGGDVSPQLSWSGAPAGTRSYAVTMYDPDAPTGSGFWHWYIINLPGDARHARNDYGDYNYGGACPPPGHGTHRYIFTIHALDCEHLDLPEDTTTARVGFNVWAHSLGSASLTGSMTEGTPTSTAPATMAV